MEALLASTNQRIDTLTNEVRSFRTLVAKWLLPVPTGFQVTLRSAGDGKVQAILGLPLPDPMPTGLKAIASQNVWVNDADGEEIYRANLPVDGSITETDPVDVDLGGDYVGFRSYQDDATPPNVSAEFSQSFTAKDDVPPDAPGPFGAIRFTE
jgi:hypothetical protein